MRETMTSADNFSESSLTQVKVFCQNTLLFWLKKKHFKVHAGILDKVLSGR